MAAPLSQGKQRWVGYETTAAETDVIKFRQAADHLELVLEQNPFYVESGGQVSDTGGVRGGGGALDVEGVEKVDGVSAVVGRFEQEFEPTPVSPGGRAPTGKNAERTILHPCGASCAPQNLASRSTEGVSWRPTGCDSISRIMGQWTTRHWHASRKK